MRNFSRFDGIDNIIGYSQHYFIEDSKIQLLPSDENGVVDLDSIVYTNPLDKNWYAGASVIKTLDLGSNLVTTSNGSQVPVMIEGTSALQDAHNLKLFYEKSFLRFIVLILDRNGSMRICGEPGNGLRFSYKEVAGGFAFKYSSEYTHPCWYASGNFTVDGTAYGATYIPVTSTIMGYDGKSAYEIALENGFEGTEAEWLLSLKGDDGADGATWRSGTGVPSNALGNDGDYYLRTTNGDVYKKAAGAYSVDGNIKGSAGNDGATWRSGTGVPSNALGNDGDYYLRTTNGDVYKKAAGAYSVDGNIKGVAGNDGATWRSGTGVPSNALGNDGDYYLRTTNGDVYKKSAGAYSVDGNIKGAAGNDGATWRSGTGVPSNALGNDGDYYLRTTNGDIYKKAAGEYSVDTNIKGPTGNDSSIRFIAAFAGM